MSIRLQRRREQRSEDFEAPDRYCSKCGHAVPLEDRFCGGCGAEVHSHAAPTSELPVVHLEEPDDDQGPLPGPSVADARRRWPWLLALLLVFLLAGGAGAYWYFVLRPNQGPYETALAEATKVAADLQAEINELSLPTEVESFTDGLPAYADRLDEIEAGLTDIEGTDEREAVTDLVDSESRWVAELQRVLGLPLDGFDPSVMSRSSDLAGDVDEGIREAAQFSDEGSTSITLDAGPIGDLLEEMSTELEDIQADRVRIRRANTRKTQRLTDVEGVVAEMDGIIDRYSTARSELGAWTDGVDQHGATFEEAYSVLSEHASRRSALRSELATVDAPPELAADQEALLAVMDQAITATQAAYRGISEYQMDFSFQYLTYDETPGWNEFESATAEISDEYASALYSYESNRDELLEDLRGRERLPAIPEYLTN